MEFIDAPVKLPAIYIYLGIILLLFITLLLTSLWNFWKTAKRYAHLPTYQNFLFVETYRLLTNKRKLPRLTTAIFQSLNNACKLFEKEGMVHIWSFRHILLIFNEEAVKVFATDEASSDKSPDYGIIKEGFGEGLVTSNGETWKKDRKLMNPAFHIRKLKAKMAIFNENAVALVKKLSKFDNKPTAELLAALESCALHNICESIFDINSKDIGSDTEIEKAYRLMARIQKYMSERWVLPPSIALLHKFFTPAGWRSLKNLKEVKQFGLKITSPRMKSFSPDSCDLGKDFDEDRKSLLHILQEQQLKNSPFTSTYVQDHVNTTLVAGSDTIVITMMWCLYLLGLNKDVQEKVYDEIQSVADDFVTYENLCQLEYLECIIKETLRLYPTIPMFARQLKKDTQCGKYTVPRGTTVLFFLYRLHRNPEIYPDPEKFDPDRFLSTNAVKRNWAYLPFSEGYRSCIGKKFAVMEIKLTLAHILRNYEVTSLDRREDLELKWDFALLPAKRLRLRITRRETIPANY